MITARRARLVAIAAIVCAVALAGAAPAPADGNASWVSAPAVAPAPPPGASPSPYPVPVGYVGDMEFWAPNRGVLITAGRGVVPQGLYAYNGVAWHQLSTVCGGSDGRIAWAGPDEFWTIADQRPGQSLPSGGATQLADVSLCHFLNGQIVGSYALPLGQPNSYQPMNAAACDAPTDCWFGGNLESGGAFHLWWNGTTVSVVDAPQDHETASMTVDAGQIYESVQLARGDSFNGESTTQPPLLHTIDATQPNPFQSLFPIPAGCSGFCPILPTYGTSPDGESVDPVTLNGLALSSDWIAGAADPQLWAVAGFDGTQAQPSMGDAHPIALFFKDNAWTQVIPDLVTLPDGDTPIGAQNTTPTPRSVAAEPNQNAAWIAVSPAGGDDGQAHVDRVALIGPNSATVTDQDSLGDAQGVGPRGAATAIACPAAQDCWVATSQGWLYHLTDGTQLAQDTDPNFAGVLTYRPPDSGVPVVSLSNASPDQLPTTTVSPITTGPATTIHRHKKPKPVITHVGRAVLHGTTLNLPITVRVRARVQLIATRKRVVVARSRNEVLGPGHHIISVKLDPHRWPTALAIKAKAVTSRRKK
jgi:hypothetical protein